MHYIAYSSSTCSAMVARVSPFYSKHNIIFPLVPKGATISWVLEKGMSAALGGRDNMCFSTHTMPPLLELLGLGLRFWSSIFVPHLNHLGIFPVGLAGFCCNYHDHQDDMSIPTLIFIFLLSIFFSCLEWLKTLMLMTYWNEMLSISVSHITLLQASLTLESLAEKKKKANLNPRSLKVGMS